MWSVFSKISKAKILQSAQKKESFLLAFFILLMLSVSPSPKVITLNTTYSITELKITVGY